MINQIYNLNMIPDKVPVIVRVSQYDQNSRTIIFDLYEESTLYEIPNGSVITVRGTKPDNTGFEYPCTFNGSRVQFNIEPQQTILAGKVPCEIRIASNNEIVGSCNFIIQVEETPLSEDIIISETDLPLLESAEQNAIRAEAAADRAQQAVSDVGEDITRIDGEIDTIDSELSNKMNLLSSPTANNILLTDANGQAIDSGTNLTNINNSIEETKVLVITTSSFSSLPQTINNTKITSDMVVVNSILSNPSAQTGNWTITTSNGSLTISGSISGSTTLTLYLEKQR